MFINSQFTTFPLSCYILQRQREGKLAPSSSQNSLDFLENQMLKKPFSPPKLVLDLRIKVQPNLGDRQKAHPIVSMGASKMPRLQNFGEQSLTTMKSTCILIEFIGSGEDTI